jgi:hypothetical protein
MSRVSPSLYARRELLLGVTAAAIVPAAWSQESERRIHVTADAGGVMRSFEDSISEFEAVAYVIPLQPGQLLDVQLASTNAANCFDIHAPNEPKPVFVGGESGNSHQLRAAKAGNHTIRVYLLRFAARDGQSARYTLELKVSA